MSDSFDVQTLGSVPSPSPTTAFSPIRPSLQIPFNPMIAQLGMFNPGNLFNAMQVAQSSLLARRVAPQMPTNILQHIRNTQLNGRMEREVCVDVCIVCGDKASGRHYGAVSCEGCKGFFKRSIRKQIGYVCRGTKDCPVTKFHRNRCQFCRLKKCLAMGMRSESVQAERRPMAQSDPVTMMSTPLPPPSTPMNPFMNGLLTIAKKEEEGPMSPVYAVKRESIGEDESGIGLLAPSESPSSSGGSSVSEDGPVFNLDRARFELPVPSQPADLNMPFICETASRLLFLSVHWMKNVKAPSMKATSIEPVMKAKWCDIFILGLMQSSADVGLPRMMDAMNGHLAACSRIGQLKVERYDQVHEQICYLLELSSRFDEAKLSSIEYAYLKLITFTSQDIPAYHASPDIRSVNVLACQELYDHIVSSWVPASEDSSVEDNTDAVSTASTSAAVERYSRLLQLLPTLRWFRPSILVDLFFSGLIGSLSIETVIPFVLKMDVMNVFDPSSDVLHDVPPPAPSPTTDEHPSSD